MLRTIGLALLLALLACGDDDGDGGTPRSDAGPGAIDGAPEVGSDAASGRACFTGLDESDPTALAGPALECPGSLCLHILGSAPDLCTAACDDAGDCFAAAESACAGGFTCAAPINTGPYACARVCVCADRVPEGGFPGDCP